MFFRGESAIARDVRLLALVQGGRGRPRADGRIRVARLGGVRYQRTPPHASRSGAVFTRDAA
jgi:hypothetical protein